jgi:glycosyltransferase involved in cell wall biosynthesis
MNTEDLADKLEKVIMQGVDIKRIHQGYEHLKKFSWKSCAINTIKAYEY